MNRTNRTYPDPEPADELLMRLGTFVRRARAARSMPRRELSELSGVSPRYLAQLEAGEGNVSVLLLRQIAEALNLPITDLLREESGQAVELALILQFLQRLPPARLGSVREHLLQQFGDSPAQRRQRIALIGLRGAGKSTLGRMLADDLGFTFVELSREIEQFAGCTIAAGAGVAVSTSSSTASATTGAADAAAAAEPTVATSPAPATVSSSTVRPCISPTSWLK